MEFGSDAIEPDFSDNDSACGELSDENDTSSLTSSALNYQYENGRRYHSYHQGEYMLPNDEQEQDRLDLSHHIYSMILKGELQGAPITHPGRVLDLGTGTGIWAIDFADAHPEAEVIGIDLSPIQPAWVPPNCRFEIDDFEQPWEYSRPFDYIHGRELEGSIRDHDKLFQYAYDNLNPKGWFEIATMELTTYSDDDTHLKAPCFSECAGHLHEASWAFGKSMTTPSTWKERLEAVGFVNVQDDVFKLPLNPWPKDPKLKEMGKYHQLNVLEALPVYTYALFTRVLGWERVQIEALLAGVRRELRDTSIHLYTKVHMVYGQKPG
ncbi:hypothetical protein N7492_001126 [Penicillium capsulatum]|uniref:Methyltransferase n=1 Tax=Penicillium capsulatum TaxID=69766 RepID=A0A9W9IUY3_9EURO|nr:hypothetical protein N7492_001126 [Penicillium capsulatum]KAJ6129817.1 hypothetical protein N7512_002597 [Penicillium capsulatum]